MFLPSLQVRTAAEKHLGLLGPVIRAEVGDTVSIVFRNAARFPTTIHAHGIMYRKDSEGAPYNDGSLGESAPSIVLLPCCPSQHPWPSRAHRV